MALVHFEGFCAMLTALRPWKIRHDDHFLDVQAELEIKHKVDALTRRTLVRNVPIATTRIADSLDETSYGLEHVSDHNFGRV